MNRKSMVRVALTVLGLSLASGSVVAGDGAPKGERSGGSGAGKAKKAKASGDKSTGAPGKVDAGQLSVALRSVRNSKGKVGCVLFRGPKGFPMKPKKALRRTWCSIKDHEATCRFPAVPQGKYAAVCIHDENGNGKLDTNWIGYPKEGTVASNHAKGRLGPPSFEDASFTLGARPKTLRLKIGY